MLEKTYKVTGQSGIHARPATMLVRTANSFVSEIQLEQDSKVVNLKSIMGVMSLALDKDTVFKLQVEGSDEEKALNELSNFLRKEKLAE